MLDDVQRNIDELSHALIIELEQAADLSFCISQECVKALNELASASMNLAALLGEDMGQPYEGEWCVTASRCVSAGCLEALDMGKLLRDGTETLLLGSTVSDSDIVSVLDIEKQLRPRLRDLLRDVDELAGCKIDSMEFKTQIKDLRESLYRADDLCLRIRDTGNRLKITMQTISASEQCLDQASFRMDVEGKQTVSGNTMSGPRSICALPEIQEGQGHGRPQVTPRDKIVLYCTHCGSPLGSGISFCVSCGAQVELIEVPHGVFAGGPSVPIPIEQCSRSPMLAPQCSQPTPSARKGGGLFVEPAKRLAAALRRKEIAAYLCRHDGRQVDIDDSQVPASTRVSVGSPSLATPEDERDDMLDEMRRLLASGGQVSIGPNGQIVAQGTGSVSAPRITNVQFAAVSPRTAARSSYCAVDIVMYEDGWEKAVEAVVEEHDEGTRTVTSGWLEAREGIHVRIDLSSPELGAIGMREGRWCGRYLRFDFAFKMPPEVRDDAVLLNASVFFDDVPATHLSFIVGIYRRGIEVSKVDRRDVSTAFLSYANKDRGRVAVIAQGIEAIRPDLDLFLDVENLRSGDDWQRVLNDEIRRRDLLFLCWSRAASESEWVDYEWRCAYGYKGIDGIEPVAIDSPDVCPPPEELKSKHFNSRLLYIANAVKERE